LLQEIAVWHSTWLLSLVMLVGVSRADTAPIGQVVVPAAPADVYAAVSNYAKWPYIFRDVKSVKVVFKDGSRTVVKVTPWKGTSLMLESHTDENQRTIRIEERGEAKARATLSFSEADRAGTTLVSAQLHGAKAKRKSCDAFDLGSIREYFSR
jgi:hypothetical protein